MFCSNCGKEVNEEDKFCGNCGAEIGNNPNKTKTINVNNSDSNLENKFNKCKKIVLGSLIVSLISFVIMVITLEKSTTENIGYFMRTIFFIAIGIYVFGIFGCSYIARKRKEKLKGWLSVLETITIVVIIVGSIVGVIAGISDYQNQKATRRNANLYIQEQSKLKNDDKTTQDINVEKTIKAFAETVRNNNNGELKFNSYSKYKTTSNGIVIYQIKYNTSYDSVKSYQLVSLNKDNTSVEKSTNVYSFYVNYDGSLTGEKNQFEYEAEKIWGK